MLSSMLSKLRVKEDQASLFIKKASESPTVYVANVAQNVAQKLAT